MEIMDHSESRPDEQFVITDLTKLMEEIICGKGLCIYFLALMASYI